MAVQSITGTVGHAFERVTLSGGAIAPSKITTVFQLNGLPVSISSAATIRDGDIVTVVGERKRGTFIAYGLRNETTGARAHAAVLSHMAVIGVFALLSFLVIPVAISVASFALAVWCSVKLARILSAQTALRHIPPPGGWAFHAARVPLLAA